MNHLFFGGAVAAGFIHDNQPMFVITAWEEWGHLCGGAIVSGSHVPGAGDPEAGRGEMRREAFGGGEEEVG